MDQEILIKVDKPELPAAPCPQARYVIAVMSFLGLAITLGQRASFSVALVAMVNFTDVDRQPNNSHDQCPEIDGSINSTSYAKIKEGEFDWDGDVQSNLLASFFYGYIVLQFIGGYIGERYSLKIMMGLCVLLPSVVNLLVPLLARWNVIALMVSRVIAGLMTGPIFPCNTAIWGRWAPLMERTSLAAMTTMGGNTGVMIATPLAGVLCDSGFLGGWPAVFYVLGGCGCVWCLAWVFLMYDTPKKHPRISDGERLYIESSIKTAHTDKYTPVPWFAVLTSRPLWVVNFSFLCDSIGYYVIFSCFPLYLREVLKYDAKWNGIIMSLIYLGNIIVTVIGSSLSDLLRRKTSLSITVLRKTFTFIGDGGTALFCLAVALVNCSRIFAVVFMILAFSFCGFSSSGYGVNPLDLAPRYSGTIMGISNGIGNCGGFLAPLLVNLITKGSASRSDWQDVFFMTSGLFGLNAVVYALFASAEEQSWANPQDSTISEISIQEDGPSVET